MVFLCPITNAQSENYYVQVGVFENQVGLHYFDKLGADIHHTQGAYGFHRYYKGIYKDQAEAQKHADQYKELGYWAVLTPQSDFGNPCVCNYIPNPQSSLNTLKNIFFDFDKSYLRSESKNQLNDLYKLMVEFPEYTTLLRAHTDSKGSLAYNEALSNRRAESARQYLISRGIASSRVKTETFGEEQPIAKNELNNGTDTAEGRQYNRRVEIVILDNREAILSEIVDEIEVPEALETSN